MGRTPGDIERGLAILAETDRLVGGAATIKADRYRSETGRNIVPYVYPDVSAIGSPVPYFVHAVGLRRIFWGLLRRFGPSVAVMRLPKGRQVFVPKTCVLAGNVVELLLALPGGTAASVCYGDSVHFRENLAGEMTHQLRPAWSPERLRWQCYVGEVIIADRAVVKAAGGRRFLRRLSPHDRALRLTEVAAHVHRLPGVLFAKIGGMPEPRSDVVAVRAHCSRAGIVAECREDEHGIAKVKREAVTGARVAVIIPTRGTTADVLGGERVLVVEAVRSLMRSSAGTALEFVVVADEETPTNVIDELQSMRDISLTVVRYDRPFNFAEKINIGTLHTDAEFLLFMNDDIEVKTTGAVETLMAYLRDGSVGQVGPMLLFEDGSVQSAGHLLNPAPFDLYRGYPPFLRGGNDMLHVAREVSSIIAAFTLTKSSVFRQVGGLCPMFPGDYNDVDFALKLSEIGLRTVFAPDVQCLHFESQTRIARQDPDAVVMLGSRWQHVLEADPYGNPHLAKYEFVWKADIDTKPALDDAFGCEVEWDDREWAVLNARDDRHLHRTRYFPKWVRLVER